MRLPLSSFLSRECQHNKLDNFINHRRHKRCPHSSAHKQSQRSGDHSEANLARHHQANPEVSKSRRNKTQSDSLHSTRSGHHRQPAAFCGATTITHRRIRRAEQFRNAARARTGGEAEPRVPVGVAAGISAT